MKVLTKGAFGLLAFAVSAPAAAGLYGVTFGGDLVRLDPVTGTGSLIGATGFGSLNSMVYQNGSVLTESGGTGQVVSINTVTGLGTLVPTAPGGDIRAMSHGPNGILYAILQDVPDKLVRLETTGTWTTIGLTGFTGIQAMACAPNGVMYAWDVTDGLLTVNLTTGAATDVGAVVGSPAIQSLEVAPNGSIYGANNELYQINPATGAVALIGSGGYSDVRGLAWDPVELLAVDLAGASYKIDFLSGSGVALGPTGFAPLDSMAYRYNRYYTSTSAGLSQLLEVSPHTGAGSPTGFTTGDFRALEEGPGARLFAIGNSAPDVLLEFIGGSWTAVGPTGYGNVEGMGWDPYTNIMYLWDMVAGLLTVNLGTGLATDVNPALGAPLPIMTLDVGPDGNLYGCHNVLSILNPATGTAGPIGGGGYANVRGMSFGRGLTESEISSYTLGPGLVFSGGPLDAKDSDNIYWQLRPGPVLVAGTPPLVLVATGRCPAFNPSALRLNLETRGSVSGLREKVELFNFRTNAYDVVHDAALATADTSHIFNNQPPGNYCGVGNIVRARFTYRATTPLLVFPWRVLIDRLDWEWVP